MITEQTIDLPNGETIEDAGAAVEPVQDIIAFSIADDSATKSLSPSAGANLPWWQLQKGVQCRRFSAC